MKIAVYCGSDFGNSLAYKEAATELGQWIGSKGYTLVYGGGEAGLMGVVAREVHEAGCDVIGVIPGNVGFICSRPQPYVSELIVADSMSDRKQRMLNLADAFIALPGGTGTLDEMAEALTLTKIGVFNKKCVLFNRNGIYDSLKQLFSDMEKEGFIGPGSMRHVLFSDDINEIASFLEK